MWIFENHFFFFISVICSEVQTSSISNSRQFELEGSSYRESTQPCPSSQRLLVKTLGTKLIPSRQILHPLIHCGHLSYATAPCRRQISEPSNHLRLISVTLRGTQRQFSENICSEDDLRSRIFGTFVVKFLACLPASPRIFEYLKNGIIAYF